MRVQIEINWAGKSSLSPSEGASWHYHHPERMGIAQPRVARNELPWGSWSNVSYPEGVASQRQDTRRGTARMRPPSACPDSIGDGERAGVRGFRLDLKAIGKKEQDRPLACHGE